MSNKYKETEDSNKLSADIALINYIEEQGAYLKAMIQELFDNSDTDKRWVSIAQSHLQQGIMAAVRSVVKPEDF